MSHNNVMIPFIHLLIVSLRRFLISSNMLENSTGIFYHCSRSLNRDSFWKSWQRDVLSDVLCMLFLSLRLSGSKPSFDNRDRPDLEV